jgi:cullin 3
MSSSAVTGKKQRINIKAFKPAVQMDSSYADNLWSVLSVAFEQIYNKNASNLSFEELYRCVYLLLFCSFSLRPLC